MINSPQIMPEQGGGGKVGSNVLVRTENCLGRRQNFHSIRIKVTLA